MSKEDGRGIIYTLRLPSATLEPAALMPTEERHGLPGGRMTHCADSEPAGCMSGDRLTKSWTVSSLLALTL